MANDLVVNLGARLDQFQSDMNQAGDIADNAVGRIEKTFSSLNPGISVGGLTAVIAGAAAGFTALTTIVASLNKGLDDMAKQAERVGISAQRFQELQFAGKAIGAGDIGDQLETFSQNAQTALSRSNDLKRVFEANGVALTDGNGKIRDMGRLLDSAFDIVRRAPSVADALQVGSFLGFSRELSQSLFSAGDNFQQLATQARELGVVIDDQTIGKAQAFTREWEKAAAIWGVSMRASMASWLPLLNDAIGVAQTLIGYVSTVTNALGAVKGFAVQTFGGQAFDAESASLIDLQKRYDDLSRIRDKLIDQKTKVGGVFGAEVERPVNPPNPTETFILAQVQEDGKTAVESVQKNLDIIADRILNFNRGQGARVRIQTEAPSVNPGLRSQGGEGRDQFEQALDQLAKRSAVLKADTATVFENTAAQAQLRAEFSLLAAIVRDNGEVTEEQVARYQKLRTEMSATQALQASGIQLTQEHAAAFKQASEGIAAATAEHTRARDRLQQLNQASAQLGSALSNSFADAVLEGKNLNEVLNQLLKSLARMAINASFASLFSPGAGGGVSPFLSFLGIGRNAEGTDNWRGGLTWVGEKGPEIVNLPRGSQVIPNAKAAQMGGQTFAPAYYINAAGADSGTVARIQTVLAQHARVIAGQSQAMASAQRMQATGVG